MRSLLEGLLLAQPAQHKGTQDVMCNVIGADVYVYTHTHVYTHTGTCALRLEGRFLLSLHNTRAHTHTHKRAQIKDRHPWCLESGLRGHTELLSDRDTRTFKRAHTFQRAHQQRTSNALSLLAVSCIGCLCASYSCHSCVQTAVCSGSVVRTALVFRFVAGSEASRLSSRTTWLKAKSERIT